MKPLRPLRKWTRSIWIALLLAAVPTHAERWLIRQGPQASKVADSGGAAFTNAPLEENGLHLLRAFRLVPWALVEGSSDAIQASRASGWIDQAELDFPRYPIGLPAARPAAFPWLLALGALAIAACGGDDGGEDPAQETCGVESAQAPSWGFLGIHADQAHSLSRGRGVRVAVIDSGIDAEHPDLDVVDGRNFVQGSPPPGATEEWDDCFGHGTHVAGILAARDNQIGTLGVAPEAQLYAARVFGCDGGGGAVSNVIAGVEWAVSQHVQVINMSLGSHSRSSAEEAAMDAALEAGVVLVAASGNLEADEPQEMTFPAAYDSVIAVAAFDEGGAIADFSLGGPDQELSAPGVNVRSTVPLCSAVLADVKTGTTGYDALGMTFSGTGTVRGGLYSCGLALAASDCPSGVSGNIALIERGTNLFSEKATNATTAGAKAVIVYNHLEEGGGLFSGTLQTDSNWIPTVSVSNTSGLAMLALGNGTSTTVDVNPGSYDIFSGTSMASPHVAGIAALILQLDPNLSPAAVRARLRATAEDIGTPGRDERSGFGRVDALRAVMGLGKVGSRVVTVSHPVEVRGRDGIGTHRPAM